MPTIEVNGVALAYELQGAAGPPLVLLHGSWGDHHNFNRVAPLLAGSFRLLSYDRRGHSASQRPSGPVTMADHVADLAALLEALDLAPAHLAGISKGGALALNLAARHPQLIRGLAAHEPPLLDLLAGDPARAPLYRETTRRLDAVAALLAQSEWARGAELFVEEVALGRGSWARLSDGARRTFVDNAPTFLDESRDPRGYGVDLAALATFDAPVLLTRGDQSPPYFAPVVDRLLATLPNAQTHTFAGAGHVPHASQPEAYAATIAAFVRSLGR